MENLLSSYFARDWRQLDDSESADWHWLKVSFLRSLQLWLLKWPRWRRMNRVDDLFCWCVWTQVFPSWPRESSPLQTSEVRIGNFSLWKRCSTRLTVGLQEEGGVCHSICPHGLTPRINGACDNIFFYQSRNLGWISEVCMKCIYPVDSFAVFLLITKRRQTKVVFFCLQHACNYLNHLTCPEPHIVVSHQVCYGLKSDASADMFIVRVRGPFIHSPLCRICVFGRVILRFCLRARWKKTVITQWILDASVNGEANVDVVFK